MLLFHDIESIPGQAAAVRAAIAAEIAAEKAEIRAPSNYKDPAKIAEYVAAKRAELDAQGDEAWRKTALDGTRGEIYCISWAVNDYQIQNVARQDISSPRGEAEMLREFFTQVAEAAKQHNRRPCFVGHNCLGFDLRFIYHRAVILGVRPAIHLPHDVRGNCESMFDTMLGWAGWGNHVKLDTICQALGIATKGTELDGEHIDGSQVWDYVARGEGQKVAIYCDADVERVRQVYRRMTFADFVQTEAA